MKKNGKITVFGEDSSTGGGFEAIWTFAELPDIAPDIFPVLPLADQDDLVKNKVAMDIRVPTEQGIHVLQDGTVQFLESVGVPTDYLIRPQLSDIMQNLTSQYESIALRLREQAISTGQISQYCMPFCTSA